MGAAPRRRGVFRRARGASRRISIKKFARRRAVPRGERGGRAPRGAALFQQQKLRGAVRRAMPRGAARQ